MREYIVHLSDIEAEAVNKAATKADLSMEDFMRQAVLTEAGVKMLPPLLVEETPLVVPSEEAKDKKGR